MSRDPTTFGVELGDRRSHIDARHPVAEKGQTMTPEQFEELKALLTEMLAPGRELSERILADMAAKATVDSIFAPPAAAVTTETATPLDPTGPAA